MNILQAMQRRHADLIENGGQDTAIAFNEVCLEASRKLPAGHAPEDMAEAIMELLNERFDDGWYKCTECGVWSDDAYNPDLGPDACRRCRAETA